MGWIEKQLKELGFWLCGECGKYHRPEEKHCPQTGKERKEAEKKL
jgi:uncharacterized OB-fold protein